MRNDIAKLIVERPRRGGGGDESKPYRREVDWRTLRQEGREEDSPNREAIRWKWSANRKEFSDYLAPIKGFLHKSVGRPWNDVWSEITANLSLGSTVQRHVLGHVFDYVEINTVEQDDGSITDSCGKALRNYRRDSFYVCPKTKILTKTPPLKASRYRSRLKFPAVRFHRIEGIWYEIGFARPPVVGIGWAVGGQVFSTREKLEEWLGKNYDFYRGFVRTVERYDYVSDVVVERMPEFKNSPMAFNSHFGRADAHWLDGGGLYCVSKCQVGKKTIRDFGLRAIREDHAGPRVVVPR